MLSKTPETAWLKPRKHRSIGSEFHPRLRISSSQILAFGKLLWTKRARGSMYVKCTYIRAERNFPSQKKLAAKQDPPSVCSLRAIHYYYHSSALHTRRFGNARFTPPPSMGSGLSLELSSSRPSPRNSSLPVPTDYEPVLFFWY